MASLKSTLERAALAKSVVGAVVADTPVAIRIKYIGSGSVTSVTVDTDQDITLVSVESGTTVTEEYLLATYTTMGALAERINNSQYWDAEVVDALRADSTASSPFVDNASLTLTADGYYDALVDTNVTLTLTYRCAYDRGVNESEVKPKGAHRVHLQDIVYYADVTGGAANEFRIYEYNPTTLAETQVYQATLVDGVETRVNFANGEGEITSDWNNDLIVRIVENAALADTCYMYVSYIAE